MNSSIFTVGKMQVLSLLALFALCAMILAPLAEVKAQAISTATLTVEKEVVIDGIATTSVPYTDFSFLINGTGETDFEADGSNDVQVATGTPVTITEVPVDGYVTTYTDCEDIVLAATSSTATCTITNTATTTGGGAPDTGFLVVNKVISGTTSVQADDFSFDLDHVGTADGDETDVDFDVDGVTYELGTGVYSVVENDPGDDFSVTYNAASTDGIGWVLDDCNLMLVTPNATTTCTITNTATSTGGTGTTTPGTGMLMVNKVISGGPASASDFSFVINGGATTTFEADASNLISNLATGTYAITEVPAANYTPTYSNCMGAVIAEGTTTTCTITNTFNVGGAQLHEIEGYVWNDEDEDGVFDENEDPLQGWTVTGSSDGELNRYDTTDVEGFYQLLVTEGTWTVSQTVQDGWEQTYPTGNTNHEVTFVDDEVTAWWNPLNWFVPIANAQAAPQLFNFGNAQIAQGGGGGGGGGGNGVRIELRDDNDDDDDDNDSGGGSSDDDDDDDSSGAPGGQVLGEQTSVFPYGAPDTGMGGGHKMDGSKSIPLMTLVLASLIGLGFMRTLRREEDEESA